MIIATVYPFALLALSFQGIDPSMTIDIQLSPTPK
jgi:hypothetical protein